MRRTILCGAVLGLMAAAGAPPAISAPAATVVIYSAGSLRGVVEGLAQEAGPLLDVEVKPTFGGSGLLRERIEKGETPDLFLSADIGSPHRLADAGRTVAPAVVFARNRMCFLSRRDTRLTADNLVKKLLDSKVRVKTSKPVEDPGGDYAWAIIDSIEAGHPGAAAVLRQKAQASWAVTAPPAAPGGNPTAALFAAHQVDVVITYCSAAAAVEKEAPELVSLQVPPALDPHPTEGMAVLSNRPEVLKLALYLLSQKGQDIVARAGLVPVAGPSP